VLVVGLQLSSACFDVADTSYGNPNGLLRANIPGEAGSISTTCDTTALKFDSGTCPSFKSDIFPYMQGPWACVSGGCHGGQSTPRMDPENPTITLAALRAANVAGRSYVPPASAVGGGGTSDLASSTSMLCNVQGACGRKMPEGVGKPLTSDEQCIITAWLNCGAPP